MTSERISIIFPSSSAEEGRLQQGLAQLGALEVHMEQLHPGIEPYLAGSDAERTRTILEGIVSNEVRMLFAARGGYGAARLPHAEIALALQTSPTPIVGFSDVTLLLHLWHSCGAAAWHGPVVTQLGALDALSQASCITLLQSGEAQLGVWPLTLLHGEPVGAVEGALTGGNLAVLESMIGYSFFPSFVGRVVILEDINEPPYKLDRMLTHLFAVTDLRAAAAIVLGDFVGCGGFEEVISRVVARHTSSPLFSGLPVGHGTRNIPWRLGTRVGIAPGTSEFQLAERGRDT